MDIGGIKGGYDEEYFHELSRIATYWDINTLLVEKNFGNGAFGKQWQGFLSRHSDTYKQLRVEDDWSSGQKELRIIDGLEPVMARHQLIINADVLHKDIKSSVGNDKYPLMDRKLYSFFFQMAKITRDKGALIHDDRLESLASAVRYWTDYMSVDADKMMKKQKIDHLLNWCSDGSHLHKHRSKHRLSGLNMMKL